MHIGAAVIDTATIVIHKVFRNASGANVTLTWIFVKVSATYVHLCMAYSPEHPDNGFSTPSHPMDLRKRQLPCDTFL
jgi:hypothetical protein